MNNTWYFWRGGGACISGAQGEKQTMLCILSSCLSLFPSSLFKPCFRFPVRVPTKLVKRLLKRQCGLLDSVWPQTQMTECGRAQRTGQLACTHMYQAADCGVGRKSTTTYNGQDMRREFHGDKNVTSCSMGMFCTFWDDELSRTCHWVFPCLLGGLASLGIEPS